MGESSEEEGGVKRRKEAIVTVIAMIPRMLTPPSGVEGTLFCMMEKPGVDISDLGVPYGIYSQPEDDEDEGNNVDVE